MRKGLLVGLRYLVRLHWGIWLALFLTSATVSVFALRSNNLQMVILRDQVYLADKSGKGVDRAIDNLRSWVYTRMNTDLTSPNGIYPPIQLAYTYNRLLKQADDDVTREAQVYCAGSRPSGYYGAHRTTCVQSYVKAHPVNIVTIPQQLYGFDFVSPTWSPDLAGWSLVATSILLSACLLRLGADRL